MGSGNLLIARDRLDSGQFDEDSVGNSTLVPVSSAKGRQDRTVIFAETLTP